MDVTCYDGCLELCTESVGCSDYHQVITTRRIFNLCYISLKGGRNMFNYRKFEKDFVEAWNLHDIEYLLSFYTDELVYIHPGEHPRVIKGKEQFKKYLEVFFLRHFLITNSN